MTFTTRAACLLALGPAMLLAGCLERRISITSDPPGALVTVNDTEVGRTPLTTTFEYYGTFDVQARKDGHQSITGPQRARAPVYEWPPIDLAAMALPVTITTTRRWHLTLPPDDTTNQAEPARRQAEADLLQRARDLASQAAPPPPAR